jgi:large subunit ribosomal protein L18
MDRQQLKQRQRVRRKHHTRKSVSGTPERPRLSVFRSNLHIYAQIIDDTAGKTLASASTVAMNGEVKYGGNVKAAEAVGQKLAAAALAKGITKVAFDRGYYKFHGRIKALAEAARKAGLKF